ncbi:DUF2807 domain-containing protein [Robiginitalea sp. M366]|uniref:head GIN domain-containing protein n=1 Tax=Robiginitalea aestuariiviva TaxID=3036903 RepID=UPI00240DFD57|nr:head GIN domain-containing protein [Robiginitalea aestuariiviva]MDG1572595.1 DUF2807 domain-containing protein [Robiginitalea aestuariiviva]
MKTMNIRMVLLLLAVMAGSGLQAQWGKRVRGNGQMTTETREVGSYDEVHVSHIFTVYLVPGNEGTLTVTGEENLMEYIETRVSGGRLDIKVRKGYQLETSRGNKNGIRVEVPVRDLSAAHASGASDLIGQLPLQADHFRAGTSGAAEAQLDIQAGHLEIDISGASTLKLSGRAGTLEIEGSGAADLRAYDLQAREAEADLSGASDVQITASERLKARVSGAADLRYKGNPEQVDSKASGAGSVKKS